MDQIQFTLDPLMDKLQAWWVGFVKLLPNITLAIIVMVLGFFLARFLKRYFDRFGARLSGHATVANLVANIATTIFVLFIILVVLSIMDLTTMLTSILAGAGVVGLAIGLAFQDPLLNLFSGILISTRSLIRIGDLIESNGYLGTVRRVSLRSTYLETMQGQEVILPNKTVAENPIKNFTLLQKRRVDLSCGVSYGEDLAKVKRVTLSAVQDGVEYDRERPVQLFFTEFGDSSINYTLRFWLKDTAQVNYLQAQSDAIMAIKRAYNDNDIMIPFPIRTLDFGIKGGEKLSEVLTQLAPEDVSPPAPGSSRGNGQDGEAGQELL